MRFTFLFSWFAFLAGAALGQQNRYIIYLDGKPDPQFSLTQPQEYLSQRSIARRVKNSVPIKFRDLPVSPSFIAAVRARGVNVLYASKWLNALLVETDSASAAQLASLAFVRGGAQRVTKLTNPIDNDVSNLCSSPAETLSTAEETDTQNAMLGMDFMHAAGNFGQGTLVAVLDAGFPEVNTASVFRQLRDSGRIAYTYDFVDRSPNVFGDHWHGTGVLSVMAGQEAGAFLGGAPKARYILLRTENADSELLDECFYWVMGAEKADSLGADVLNSSLGYTLFDNPRLNFSVSDLDGNRLFISRAAEHAADCGIIVVASAGNEGMNPLWSGKIGAPSDADSILTVGAVFSDTVLAPFSSMGPSADGRIKPEVSAQGVNCAIYDPRAGSLSFANGTSFSAPLIASLAAGLVTRFPEATAMQIRSAIMSSGSQSSSPDTLLGYGVPSYRKASSRLTSGPASPAGPSVIYPNPVRQGTYFMARAPGEELLKEIQVFDNLGRNLGRQKARSGRFRAPDVPGVYRVQFTGEHRYTIRTLVVEP